MKTDKRLKTLCEEFDGLEEAEKDYILGVSRALAFPASAKNGNFYKNIVPLPVGAKESRYNRPQGGI
jgi:hypothetical protein